MKVLLVDRNTEALAKAKTEVIGGKADDGEVSSYVLDVSQLESWAALKNHAVSSFGSIELLVLNAGMGMEGTWGDSDYFRTVREMDSPGR